MVFLRYNDGGHDLLVLFKCATYGRSQCRAVVKKFQLKWSQNIACGVEHYWKVITYKPCEFSIKLLDWQLAAWLFQDLYRKTRSILNKLTPQKFQVLLSQMQALKIDTESKLKGVVDLVFEKAISEPLYTVVYANMGRCLSMVSCSGNMRLCWEHIKLIGLVKDDSIFKDARSVSLYPFNYNRSQILQYVKFTK